MSFDAEALVPAVSHADVLELVGEGAAALDLEKPFVHEDPVDAVGAGVYTFGEFHPFHGDMREGA